MPERLRIGTRGSRLALAQADVAVARLEEAAAEAGISCSFEIARIRTKGDRHRDLPFEAIGPKGVFAAELQIALLRDEVDVAVHSAKDLPATEPDGLAIGAVPPRIEPRDVLVSRGGQVLDELPAGSSVGTSSARRRAQLGVLRPELEVVPFRGNVDTRLRKVSSGEVDAAILAGAGIRRLGRQDEVTEWLDPARFLPPPGQGAIAIEVRMDQVFGELAWIGGAEDGPSRTAFDCERAFMQAMEGGCEVPLGGWARVTDGRVVCDGFVADEEGRRHFRASATGDDPRAVGEDLARDLLDAGAGALLAEVRGG